jgi:hypothetical protein
MLIVLIVFGFAVLVGAIVLLNRDKQLRGYGATKEIKEAARTETDESAPEPKEFS